MDQDKHKINLLTKYNLYCVIYYLPDTRAKQKISKLASIKMI